MAFDYHIKRAFVVGNTLPYGLVNQESGELATFGDYFRQGLGQVGRPDNWVRVIFYIVK